MATCGGYVAVACQVKVWRFRENARQVESMGEEARMLTVLDLFSGIGGFSLGLERAGMKTIQFVEIDPFCRKVLKKHWPEVPQHDDIKTYTGTPGFADVICGGFPCQDLSYAGKGEGIEGARSGLWKEYARIIGEVRPRYAIVENVSALLSRGLGVVLGDLAEIGYNAEWHCLSAGGIGAPHRRNRIWIICYPQHSDTDHAGSHRTQKHINREAEPANQQIRISGSLCKFLADAMHKGLQGRGADRPVKPELGGSVDGVSAWLGGSWEQGLERLATGVPNRVDRLKSLGNAVVPQISELIGRAILEAA